jgi:uncharacterized membrane protein YhaH (DUF805 family)
MFGSIRYNLTHLFDFRGRDARQTFWYYVLFLAIIKFLAGIAIAVPLIANMVSQIMAAARAGVTDQQELNAMMASQMGGWAQSMVPFSIGLNLIMAALFVAAFVRRLHDSDKSGWWAILPVATQLTTIWVSYRSLGNMQNVMLDAMQHPGAGMQYQSTMAPYTAIGWLGYLVVIVFGVFQSTPGPNRYGEAPVVF